MKDSLIKAAIFLLSFVISLIIISSVMNRGTTDMTVEMGEATLPVVSIVDGERLINRMYGVKSSVEPNMMRDTLTPLNEGRSLDIHIDKYDNRLKEVAYEVRSLDAERLIEDTEILDYLENDDTIEAKLHIKDLISDGKEYILAVRLTNEQGQKIYYYTRIIYDDSLHEKEILDFVRDFTDKTFDKTAARSLTTYLESDSSGDNSSYYYVDIHSSFDQITYGNLSPEKPEYVMTEVLEMDRSTASLRNRFLIVRESGGEKIFYDVSEYFRVRYTEKRIYLLNYERKMEQVFDPDSGDAFVSDKVILGISDPNVMMMENEDGGVIAFVQNGSLYAFRNTDSKAVRIFSFFEKGDDDERNRNDDHGIKILQVDEAGNVHFLLYGYMNRGRHEGEIGISAYYFNSALNQIEEEVYIPYTRSYQFLRYEVEKLSYSPDGNHLYLYLMGRLIDVHLDTKTVSVMAGNIFFDSFVVSKSGRTAAWQAKNDSGIFVCDFNDGNIREILGDPGITIRALGFLGEDLVYGSSTGEHSIESPIGITMDAMEEIYIENNEGEILKTYSKEGIYITGVDVKKDEITLARITMDEEGVSGNFLSIEPDMIVDNDPEAGDRNAVITVATEELETIVEIALAGHINNSSVHVVTPKEVLFEGERNLALEEAEDNTKTLIVYSRGGIDGIYESAYKAVSLADERGGVVVKPSGRYIWQKGNRALEKELKDISEPPVSETQGEQFTTVLSAIFSHEGITEDNEDIGSYSGTLTEIIDREIDGADALELGGCSLNSVLYYVSQGRPVVAEVEGGNIVMIIGYDLKNTLIFDPSTGSIYKKGMNDSTEWFGSHGNEFVSYVIG
ncbi:MAG: C39 family peptidase [Lachnospiraceae bacterium]|nr:C39 family peptidase [Lachnospiraceae bacterium]